MERLTQRCNCGICGSNERVLLYPLYKIGGDEYMDYGLINQCFEKLAMYEDAEEQGLLLRLPVAEGTEVFAIMESYFYEEFGYGVEPWYSICGENFDRNMIEYFGKTVFLTREEAEAALEKLKGEEHEKMDISTHTSL